MVKNNLEKQLAKTFVAGSFAFEAFSNTVEIDDIYSLIIPGVFLAYFSGKYVYNTTSKIGEKITSNYNSTSRL